MREVIGSSRSNRVEDSRLDEIKEAAADDDCSVSNFIVATVRKELKRRKR